MTTRASIGRASPGQSRRRVRPEAGAVRMGSYRDRIGGAAASGSTRNVPASLLAPAAASRPARRTSIRAPSRPPPFTSRCARPRMRSCPGSGRQGRPTRSAPRSDRRAYATSMATTPAEASATVAFRTERRHAPSARARSRRARVAIASRCFQVLALQPFPLAVSADLPLCFRLLTTIGQTRNASYDPIGS